MAADFSYSRPKATVVNATPINIAVSPTQAETGGGTTGIAQVAFTADADESGGADVQTIGTFVITPVLTSSGNFSFTVAFTPKLGAGTDGTAESHSFVHPQTMDVWQTTAGRARQA